MQKLQSKQKKKINKEVANLTKHIEDELKKRGRRRGNSYSDDDDQSSDLKDYKMKALNMRRTRSFKMLLRK